MSRIFITGTAGFVGYHLARRLLDAGFTVHGFDGMTSYYDVSLKERRHAMLGEHAEFTATEAMLEDMDALAAAVERFRPQVVVHLAAQAGVRYSLEAPRSYVNANLVGTFNMMECVRESRPRHFLLASTSSVYGGNETMPFQEVHRADAPLTTYAATKKATEAMAHSYAHLWDVPTTAVRLFTAYGPWGRPDMALFKFTDAILDGRPIDVYNHGDMHRDFTFVDDVVRAIGLLIDTPPPPPDRRGTAVAGDSVSPVAPFRTVNIGNSKKTKLSELIEAIEAETGLSAIRNHLEMQPGDVRATWADTTLLNALTGFRPQTELRDGVSAFVRWFRDYYGK